MNDKNVEASLNWESWEQFNLWRLISAQAVSIEDYISILPRLNSQSEYMKEFQLSNDPFDHMTTNIFLKS